MHRTLYDPASFRDASGRVLSTDDAVFRGLNAAGLADYETLAASGCLADWIAAGKVVPTRLLRSVPPACEAARDAHGQPWAGWLEHERLPVISYPFEWCFSMLREAALLELELLQTAIARGFVLKDGSPYNVQFRGTRPEFIDVGSLAPYCPGEVWAGYAQFCRQMLFPLMLASYKGVPFQPWLRGCLEGIEAAWLRALLGWRDWLRPGVLTHVVLQAMLERRAAARSGIRRELQDAGFHRELILANVRRLQRLIDRLRPPVPRSHWVQYDALPHYSPADRKTKRQFVERCLGERRWRMVWDLGCNTGSYTEIVASHADYTLALDADQAVIEQLYAHLRERGVENVLPLVFDALDHVAGLGWRGGERPALRERARPELVVCLGLIHHLAIGGNVPLAEVLDWFAGLAASLVIEFVDRQDVMAARLLSNKATSHDGYRRDVFERELHARFRVVSQQPLPNGTRTLYFAHRRAARRSQQSGNVATVPQARPAVAR